ncbi:MAG: hypothetical protein IPP07_19850 [Holophagales bacterium]|nr:hypothetical protein [Holophagales bacterium]MBK9967011.1 hypothetical protein [Holophagales bacterium]
MKRIGTCRVGALFALSALGATLPAAGQGNVKVVVAEVADDRISAEMATGGLVLTLNLAGDGLDDVKSARIRVKEAKDDTGKSLVNPKASRAEFSDRNSNAGNIQVTLENPPRGAASVRLSGTADLFIPMRDPNSLVKVPGFLARPGKPVPSKGLGAAKVEVTVLSKDSYVEELKKDRLDEKKIAAIRAEAKERGMKDGEVESLIEMAKAFDEIGASDFPEHGLYLRIPKAGEEKIQDFWLETASGERIETGGSAGRTAGETVLKQIDVKKELPKDAVLVVSLFTDKAIVSVPFDIKEVPLP